MLDLFWDAEQWMFCALICSFMCTVYMCTDCSAGSWNNKARREITDLLCSSEGGRELNLSLIILWAVLHVPIANTCIKHFKWKKKKEMRNSDHEKAFDAILGDCLQTCICIWFFVLVIINYSSMDKHRVARLTNGCNKMHKYGAVGYSISVVFFFFLTAHFSPSMPSYSLCTSLRGPPYEVTLPQSDSN